MSIPGFSEFPGFPSRSAPEADFDAKMYALFQHFATTHRNEMLAFIDFLENNSTVIGAALNGTVIGDTVPAAGTFTDLAAETIGGAAVQSSLTDATAGKLMKVGAFGLGADTAEVISDIDDYANLYSGSYRTSATESSGTFPDAAVNGTLRITRFSANRQVQELFPDLVSNICYRRIKANSGWSDWHQVLSDVDVVSGSGPTGDYVRFPNGLQICMAAPFSTANGAAVTWTYPAPFVSAPVLGGIATSGTAFRDFTASNRSPTSVDIRSFDENGSEAVSPSVDLSVIGFWK